VVVTDEKDGIGVRVIVKRDTDVKVSEKAEEVLREFDDIIEERFSMVEFGIDKFDTFIFSEEETDGFRR